jgi:hypothetical protein
MLLCVVIEAGVASEKWGAGLIAGRKQWVINQASQGREAFLPCHYREPAAKITVRQALKVPVSIFRKPFAPNLRSSYITTRV